MVRRKTTLVTAIVSIIVGVLLGWLFLPIVLDTPEFSPSNRATTISALGNLALTLALVYLYAQQTQIQSNQQTMMERGQRPRIQVSDVRAITDDSGQRNPRGGYDDYLKFRLNNRGNGTAEDLDVLTYVIPARDEAFGSGNTSLPYPKIDGEVFGPSIGAVEYLDKPPRLDTKEILTPDDGGTMLKSPIGLQGAGTWTSLSNILTKLTEKGSETVYIHIYLLYTDTMGRRRAKRLLGVMAEPTGTFEEIILDSAARGLHVPEKRVVKIEQKFSNPANMSVLEYLYEKAVSKSIGWSRRLRLR